MHKEICPKSNSPKSYGQNPMAGTNDTYSSYKSISLIGGLYRKIQKSHSEPLRNGTFQSLHNSVLFHVHMDLGEWDTDSRIVKAKFYFFRDLPLGCKKIRGIDIAEQSDIY